jgi:uncharacterized protein DUF6265
MSAAAFLLMFVLQPAPPAPSVKALDWMIGCWTTERGEATSWESWIKASDEVMFGVSYTLRAGKVTEFEFLRVEVRQGRLVYLAQPNGNPVTAFELVPGGNSREAIFANPTHDFPKRVAYRATPAGLLAWIDGGDAAPARRIEYPMTRVSCDSAPR